VTVINVQILISRIKLLPQSLLLSPMAKVLNRLCLNTQCSLITTITWPTPYFDCLFDDKIFVIVDKKAGIFAKHIWQP